MVKGVSFETGVSKMSLSVLFLVVSLIVFALGAWSRWWAAPTPYYLM